MANDWNAQIIQEFRSNHGQSAAFPPNTLLLLTSTGAKSGKQRTNPLMYRKEGNRYYVFASAGGSTRHPDWYRNILANPKVTVEVGDETFPATAKPLQNPDRERIYRAQATEYPQFAEYEKTANRDIPVVELTPDNQ